MKPTDTNLAKSEIDRVIQMAWEDRTSFDAIRRQFGLTSGEVMLRSSHILPELDSGFSSSKENVPNRGKVAEYENVCHPRIVLLSNQSSG